MAYLRDPEVLASQPYHVYRSVFVARMEPEEAEILEGVLNSQESAKLRLLYNAVDYFMSDDMLFVVLHATVATALSLDGGATPNMARADELLAPG
ncbi:hypothetical protein SAMN06295905_1324 [Devosia lucknowensis]|uniref:Uncharacterized protein n=1 Tax=Devosia lucknowensis TaxID=1096929 RepID=A0A1Y6ESW1_9HYPH|nr:hypothetical protein [Devosia lucknowensis]SMQ65818.1 hypothetical protein SAMN06295905_1324 [Devosia lucknowensis]